MAVRADQRFAGDAEPLQMHLMADAVAGAGEVQPVLFAYGLDIPMVVGVFKTGLQCVVVNISDGALRADTGHAHGFKFKIRHGAGGILCQGLVNAQSDLLSDGHIAADQVRADQFLRESISHKRSHPLSKYPIYYIGQGAVCQPLTAVWAYFRSRGKFRQAGQPPCRSALMQKRKWIYA